ncbi:MAG: aminopeptidase, partial [Synergistaceae bacterium]|nr:aminopeptidase [Synergistaceae bacterium]
MMKFETIEAGSRIGNRQVLGVALYEDFTAGDLSPLPSSIALLTEMHIPRGNFKAKRGRVMVVPLANGETQCVVLAGMGARGEARPDDYRLAAYNITKAAATRGKPNVSMAIPGAAEYGVSRAIGEGVALACYRFEKYHAHDEDDRFSVPENVAVLDGNVKALGEGFTIGECQSYARNLANEPGNVIKPAVLATRADALASENGLDSKVLDEKALAEKGMNALLAVGKGSASQPRL